MHSCQAGNLTEAITAQVRTAAESHDLILLNAGSSAGSEDFSAGVVETVGQLLVHGVAVRPGHPVILGAAKGKALVGIPGYPVSAAMTFDLIVKPLLYLWQGNYVPKIKAASRLRGIDAGGVRAPLQELSPDEERELAARLEPLG